MRRSREMASSYRVGFSYCQWPSINLLLTIRWQSSDSFRTALTQCTSWCVYLMAFVMRQPSARSTPPVDSRLDDTLETEAGVRWMAGRSSNAGTLANGLTEMRSSPVSMCDIKVRVRVQSITSNLRSVGCPELRENIDRLSKSADSFVGQDYQPISPALLKPEVLATEGGHRRLWYLQLRVFESFLFFCS
jgi:hypothetical protein